MPDITQPLNVGANDPPALCNECKEKRFGKVAFLKAERTPHRFYGAFPVPTIDEYVIKNVSTPEIVS